MFVKKKILMEIRNRFPQAWGRRRNRLVLGGVAYLLDTCAAHMFFSALLQDHLIDNMLGWERRTACRGFRNPLSHGYLGWWCCY